MAGGTGPALPLRLDVGHRPNIKNRGAVSSAPIGPYRHDAAPNRPNGNDDGLPASDEASARARLRLPHCYRLPPRVDFAHGDWHLTRTQIQLDSVMSQLFEKLVY